MEGEHKGKNNEWSNKFCREGDTNNLKFHLCHAEDNEQMNKKYDDSKEEEGNEEDEEDLEGVFDVEIFEPNIEQC